MSIIDLHIHSKISGDGEYTSSEIVNMCSRQGMKLISITDHNSVRGIAEAMKTADSGLKVIPGIELDCIYGGRNFHLLGYKFDYTQSEFLTIEEDILRQERAASEEKIYLFRKVTGIALDEREIFAASDDGVVTGEMIAEILLSKQNASQYEILRPYLPGGKKSDMPNVRFYWDFFSEGKPAYVPIHYISLPEAIALIKRAGGYAVIAHPAQNLRGEYSLLFDMFSEGIDGVEAFSSYHGKAASVCYYELAQLNHLLVTCGSDFHGKHKPRIKLGGHGAVWDDNKLLAGLEESFLA